MDHRLSTVVLSAAALYSLYTLYRLSHADCDLTLGSAPRPSPTAFRDKIVWITGASSGIGEELAKRLAKAGAKLILSARRLSELERVKQSLGLGDDRVRIVVLDLGEHDSLLLRAKEANEAFGGVVDVLINNGGVSTRTLAKDTSIDIDKKVMNVDFFGQVICAKAVLPGMMQRKSGQIVNIVSLAGKLGTPLRTAYCAAKFALMGHMDALRLEQCNNGIRSHHTGCTRAPQERTYVCCCFA